MSELRKDLEGTGTTQTIKGRLQQALDLILWQGKSWDDAATEAGLTTRSMRLAMARPNVIKYLRLGVKERLGASQARALVRLEKIMSDNDQMPGVQAAKTILGLTFDDYQTKQTSPGVVIQIISDKQEPKTVIGHVVDTDGSS